MCTGHGNYGEHDYIRPQRLRWPSMTQGSQDVSGPQWDIRPRTEGPGSGREEALSARLQGEPITQNQEGDASGKGGGSGGREN
jgi:hypothetical protein